MAAKSGSDLRGAELLNEYECNRCHSGGSLGAAAATKDCVGCHQAIMRGEIEADSAVIEHWRQAIHSLPAAPSFDGVGLKLRRDWVVRQLLAPTDVRPGLLATMPRLPLSPPEAVAIAEALVPAEAEPMAFDMAAVSRGRRLFAELRCASCHRFSGAAVSALSSQSSRAHGNDHAVILAPDLRHTRDRFQSGRLVQWLRNPQRISPSTLMPNHGLDDAAASALAAFIMLSELQSSTPQQSQRRLELLGRPVGYEEVSKRVFRKVCWHCHSTADYARGDGGPGNTGGFGFAPRGLDLSSYTGSQSGVIGADGERASIFAPGPDGVPWLVTVLLARHVEVAGGQIPGVRGMPLGLPALPHEDIALVATWIAQGRPLD